MKYEIDDHFVALKLVEVLFRKGLVNKETFENVKAKYPEVFTSKGAPYLDACILKNVKGVE